MIRSTLAVVAFLSVLAAGCAEDASTRAPQPRHPARAATASSAAPQIASAAPSSSAAEDAAVAIAKWKSGKPAPTAEASRPFFPAAAEPLLLGVKKPTVSASLHATAFTDGETFVVTLSGEVACKKPFPEEAFSASFSFFGSSGSATADGSLNLEDHGQFGAGGGARAKAVEGRPGVFTVSGDSGFRGRQGDGALVVISLESSCGDLPDLAQFVIAIPPDGPPRLRVPTPAELAAHRKR